MTKDVDLPRYVHVNHVTCLCLCYRDLHVIQKKTCQMFSTQNTIIHDCAGNVKAPLKVVEQHMTNKFNLYTHVRTYRYVYMYDI